VDSAKPAAWPEPLLLDEASRLKALAVFGLLGRDGPAAGPLGAAVRTGEGDGANHTVAIDDSRHIWLFKPLVSAAVAAARAFFSAA